MNGLFTCVEAEAWCRGFDYEEYVNMFVQFMKGNPVSDETYKLLCVAFENQMEEDIGVKQ